jgi:hypothetical protein
MGFSKKSEEGGKEAVLMFNPKGPTVKPGAVVSDTVVKLE